ncbi:MAG: glycosyltransferase family 9 protein [Rhodospirillales bacterium]|jgi:ADP-heptose:LPS heptosyltransferase|nr:glycosyltransferase family 9 protein [Rhodospirillales bacterium]
MAKAHEPPQSVLVYVGLDRIGDGLLKLPFVRGLRQAFPQAKITWLAGKDTSVYGGVMAPLVAGLLDEVIGKAGIGLHPKELLRRPLGGRRFDLIIDTQRVALASLVLFRIRHEKFISPFGRFFLSSTKPPAGYRFPRPMQRQMLDLLEMASGQEFPTPDGLEINLDEELERTAQSLLPPGPVYLGLAPGAGGKPKCWPLENFISLANQQAAAGRIPVFFLGPQEEDWHSELARAVPQALFPLQTDDVGRRHDFAPSLTIALAKYLAVAVSNDSGAGHMLAIGGVPLVSLFGRTVPEKFVPMARRLEIIRAQDHGGREMHFIPLAPVSEAVEMLLAEPGS